MAIPRTLLRPLTGVAALALLAAACADDAAVDDALGESAAEESEDADDAADDADEDDGSDASQDDAGGEGSLTFYSAGPGGLAEELVAAFEEETGIEVDLYQATTGDVLGRLEAEMGNPIADVVYLASWVPAVNYRDEGHTRPYTPEGADTLNEGWADPDGHFHGRDGSALALTVNTELAPSMPSDWGDLTDEAWSDLVAMPDPRESGTARDFVAALQDDRGADAWELFDGLADNGLSIEGPNRPTLDSVVDGSNAAVAGGVDYMGYGDIEDGEPLEVVLPESGTIVTPRPMFITEWAENVEEAEAFVDFAFSEPAQELVVEQRLMPARTDVEVADIMTPFAEVPLLDYDWANIEQTGEEVLSDFVAEYVR